ncbi:precorrin-6A synthase (deacetylating) [Granulicoccus sp. GXG6511]|uniref:precorrin-6A synthase (deacetylating) n=1 Tax=Granulicoccus sp. GXG6511 TaxID=3381351 RepID=UPI003D7CEED7
MTSIKVIGIGPGGTEQVTRAAVVALNEVDVFLVADKGGAKRDLVAAREEICARWITGDYRLVEVPDPERGPDAERDAAAYGRGVTDWHRARTERYRAIIAAEPDLTYGFLVWGDPAFYDSTLRIVDALAADLTISCEVVPGISAIQLLAARHRVPLNRVGRPFLVTTGRRLLEDFRDGLDVVVMLDGHLACRGLTGHGLEICWGAYLGDPREVLVRGPLDGVIDELIATRAALRERHGWVMDTYLLRPEPG